MTQGNRTSSDELLAKKIRTQEHGEQTIELAEREIERLCDELDLSEGVFQVATAIYRRSLEEKFIENRTIGMVAAASVYAACRVEKDLRPSEEVSRLAIDSNAKVAGEDTILQRIYSEMSRVLDLKTGPVDPEAHVPRIIEKLNLNEICEEKAEELLDCLDGEFRSGKSPMGLAAGAVYGAALLTNEKRTQKDVAEATNVGVSTIRPRYQEIIEEYADLELEDS